MRVKGILIKKIIIRYVFWNVIVLVFIFVGLLMVGFLIGIFVIEKIFLIFGFGKYFVDSIFNWDYLVIMGIIIFYSVFLIVCIFIIDIIYCIVDLCICFIM